MATKRGRPVKPENRKGNRKLPKEAEPYKFKPGQSGNPGGRPKGVITVALLKQLLRKAARGQKRDLEAIVEGIITSARAGNSKAFCAIRDTVDGPPKQAIEHGGEGGGPMRVRVEHIGSSYGPDPSTA